MASYFKGSSILTGTLVVAGSASITNITPQTGTSLNITGSIAPTLNAILPYTTTTSGAITSGGELFAHNFGTDNTFFGLGSGNLTLTAMGSTCIGDAAGHVLTSGSTNTFIGAYAGTVATTAAGNTALGNIAGTALTTASNNTLIGFGSGSALTTGSGNIFLGQNAGNLITTTGSNICIGHTGIAGDTSLIRIGTSQTSVYVAGISGAAAGTSPQMVMCGSEGKLSTQGFPGVIGPGSATSTALALFNGTTGALIMNSTATLTATATLNLGDPAGNLQVNAVNVFPTTSVANQIPKFSSTTGRAFSASTLTIDASNNLVLTAGLTIPATTTSVGVISVGAFRYIHSFGTQNSFMGTVAGNLTLTSSNNIGIGYGSGSGLTSGGSNTLVGAFSGNGITTGIGNTCVGASAGQTLTTGAGNIFIGSGVGNGVLTTTSYNIIIGNLGVSGDANCIRIGTNGGSTGQTSNYTQGIYGASAGTSPQMVVCGSEGKLSTSSDHNVGGNLNLPTTTATVGNININASRFIHAYGSANTWVGASAGNYTTTSTGNVCVGYFTGNTITSGSENTCLGDSAGGSITTGANNTYVGSGAGSSGNTAGSNTCIGALAGAGITTGSLNICIGYAAGNALIATSNAILIGHIGITGDANLIRIGTSGTQTATYIAGVNGAAAGTSPSHMVCGTDGKLSTSDNINLVTTTSTAGNIMVAGTRFIHAYGNNTWIGSGAGNYTTTANSNVGVGASCGATITSGTGNACLGDFSGAAITTGTGNVYVGNSAGTLANTGGSNVCVGQSAGSAITTGSLNICLGYQAGNAITTTGTNIIIGNSGTVGDANLIKIGTSGTHTKTFVAGVRGITTANANAITVVVDSAGQLGTVSSSRKFKENIQDIESSEKIYELRPAQFNYKTQPGTVSLGLIAEEVNEVCPEMAVWDNGELLTVDYSRLPIMMLREMQKMKTRMDAMEAIIGHRS